MPFEGGPREMSLKIDFLSSIWSGRRAPDISFAATYGRIGYFKISSFSVGRISERKERVPHLVGDPRVKYVQVDRHIHSDKIKRFLLLCEKANLLTRVHSTYASSLPLAAAADKKFFKIIFLDIGLLHHPLGFDWRQVSPDADLTNICHGAFAEQFVGQELLAHADILDQRNLYYWYRKAKGSDAKVDYVVSSHGSPAPVEVKSGSRGTLKSLNMYIEKYQPKEAFVLSQ
jgi:hypothetical protein